MNYQTRLLKFLKTNNNLFTPHEIASIWKRSKWDVEEAAFQLSKEGQIKIKKDWTLKLAY